MPHGGCCHTGQCHNEQCHNEQVLTEALNIDVELVNKANVVASHHNAIYLRGGKKSGPGFWRANTFNGNGLMVIQTEIVLEDATWTIGDETDITSQWRVAKDARIQIDTGATFTGLVDDLDFNSPGTLEITDSTFDLPGYLLVAQGTVRILTPLTSTFSFGLSGGSLHLEEDFDTSGNFTAYGGSVTVFAGKIATFAY